MEGFVYRAYDRAGRLLYVGSTLSSSSRTAAHRTQTEWYSILHQFTVRRYATIERARRVELRAIAILRPIYNIRGNPAAGRAEQLAARFGDQAIADSDRWAEFQKSMARINAADPKEKPIKSTATWGRWLKDGCPGADDGV